MRTNLFVVLLVGSICLGAIQPANSGELTPHDFKKMCGEYLMDLGSDSKSSKSQKHDLRTAAIVEEHPFSVLLDPEFVRAHPLMLMSSDQMALAAINIAGVEEVLDPITGANKVKRYKLFSDGGDLTSGSRVVGALDTIQSLVNGLAAGASGHDSGKSLKIVVAGPGTGKSVLLTTINNALKKLSLTEPKMFQYTFEMTNLDKIPEVKNLFDQIRVEGSSTPMRSQINDFPFALLPESLQKAYVEKFTPEVIALCGYPPIAKFESEGQARRIRDMIMIHYSRTENAGKPLSIEQELYYLSKHVVLKRNIPGDDGGSLILPAQGKQIDTTGLFFKQNPLAIGLEGANAVFSYAATGIFPRSNNQVFIMDEAGKYPPDLHAKMLTFTQDKTIQEGGSPTLFINSTLIAATNTKDIQRLKAEDPDSALLSRSWMINMPWHLDPVLEAETIAYGMKDLMMQKLGDPNAPILKASEHLQELFPHHVFGHEAVTSDGRYRLWVGSGESRVEISPKALLFAGAVPALTRQFFITQEELEAENNQVAKNYPFLTKPLLNDRVARLRAWIGLTPVDQQIAISYKRLSAKHKEGSFGFGNRDSSRWFEAAIARARMPGGGKSVTVGLLDKTLGEITIDHPLTDIVKDDDGKDRYSKTFLVGMIKLSDLLKTQVFIPQMKKDVMSAIVLDQDESIKDIYRDVIQALAAKGANPSAQEFSDVISGTTKPIIEGQLTEIRVIYAEQNGGRGLSAEEINNWHVIFGLSERNNGFAIDPKHALNQSLLSAVAQYHANQMAAAWATTVDRLLRVATGKQTGTPDEIQMATDMIRKLKLNLGYSEQSIKEVLQVMLVDANTKRGK